MAAHLIVYVLAVWRWTRLVIDDRITAAFRARLIRRSYKAVGVDVDDMAWWELDDMVLVDGNQAPPLAYFMRCYWCAGLWVSAVFTALRWWARDVGDFAATVGALSAGAVLAQRGYKFLVDRYQFAGGGSS